MGMIPFIAGGNRSLLGYWHLHSSGSGENYNIRHYITHYELQQALKYIFYSQAIGQLLTFPEIERLQQTVVCNVENLILFC